MIAILIHNIPEGMAIAIPIYYSTKSKTKAIALSFLAGLAESIGALLGYVVLYSFMSEELMASMFAVIAGIMVYISLDELLPAAEKYGEHHLAIRGLVFGMAVMAVSLIFLG
ncbi:MAG: hypothetical protein A2Y22_05545 [Clostridiales bacterium GWD2_32_59]|nr:MAG: hypothetical protein A2Y22_05545 [Clostridiales bacterium GWD2_32_59]